MASKAVIPRFLLPLQSPLWRGARIPLSASISIRYASTGKPAKPIVLEKPAKFNPPSHGSRLKRNALPKHYGPQLTPDDLARQNVKHYPGLMAPEGSWTHWFWHARLLHTVITMGTLFMLGVFTFFMNYAHNSPFKDLVPPIADLWQDPIYFFVAWKNVIIMHERDKGAKAQERRFDHLDDVAKRRYFMKMHGIEVKDPITVTFGRGKRMSDEEVEAKVLGMEPPPPPSEEDREPLRKKWFGFI